MWKDITASYHSSESVLHSSYVPVCTTRDTWCSWQ